MKQFALPTYRGSIYYPTEAILHFRVPVAGTIERISFYLPGTPSADGHITLDVNLNYESIFAAPGDRPVIGADGESFVIIDGLDIDVVRGDILEIDVDSLGAAGGIAILDVMFDIEDGVSPGAGPQGPPGADGLSFVWHGAWSNATAYAARDVVEYQGSSWIAIAASTNVAPGSDPTKWEIMAQAGTNGAAGADGADGQSLNPRGGWNGATAYVPLDVVSYQGSSYVAHAPSTNIVPPDASAWTLLSSKGDTGAQGPQGAPGTGGSGSGGGAEADFITGLELSVVGNTWDDTIQVSPGAAWVPGLNKVVRLAAATNCTPPDSNSQLYYVYLKEVSGAAAIECVSTAPGFYQGDAQQQTGDNTRRFIGYYYRDGVIGINNFFAAANGNRAIITWRKALYSVPLLFANALTNTASDQTITPQTSGNNANFIPTCAAILHLVVRLSAAANSRVFVGLSQFNADSGNGDAFGGEVLIENDNTTGSIREVCANVDIHLNRGTQAFHYWLQQFSGSGASLTIHCRSITYRR